MELEASPEPQRWQVAVNAPLREAFTYQAGRQKDLAPGVSVRVPFGPKNREVAGLVVKQALENPDNSFKAKTIVCVDEERPPLSEKHLKWLQWVARYYLYPLGQVQQLVFPPLKKHSQRKSRKKAVVPEVPTITPHPLTEDQQRAVDAIAIDRFDSYLLHGVTGSGKTEIYIEVISQVLAQNKSALVLVPEISLTPQLIRRFAERFPGEIAVIHSQLTDREKTDQWWQAVDGKKRLLIGARSALFCPLPNLGVVVIDEEHETSFKQEEKLKYNARDVAIVKAQMEDCPIILGSATPSLETWYNAQKGKYKLITLAKRVSDRPLPQVEIINPHQSRDSLSELPFWLSENLFNKLKSNYEKQHQSALFLNRRGVAPNVQCYQCGFSYHCPNCDISLTLHGKHHLVCHYCNYHDRMSEECPDCQQGEPKAYGLGTEAVEQGLAKLFPQANIFRADRDEISSREAIEDMVKKMESNQIDFLVGTQMIAKGLDFKNLTLVGVVHADVAFNVPDFRASERSFQLCTQVSGRAGRHQIPGEVVIQTYKPKHPSLVAAKKHDYYEFAKEELKNRQLFNYPPFGKITAIRLSSLREEDVIRESQQLTEYLTNLVANFKELATTQVLGPTPAPLSRIKNRYRYHILLKAPDHKILNHVGDKALSFIRTHIKKSKCLIDVDPYSLL